jgi:hypothetical protein
VQYRTGSVSLGILLGFLALLAALQALRSAERLVAGRAATVAREHSRLVQALVALGAEVASGQANVLWLRAPGLDGAELARRLEQAAVFVAPGGPLASRSGCGSPCPRPRPRRR